jgi:hypothetical protein
MYAITELEVLKYLISLVNEDKKNAVMGMSADMQEAGLEYLFNKYLYEKWVNCGNIDTTEIRVEEKEN